MKSRLSNLEEYFTSREEIEQNDPGMMSKMLSNVIDNIQVSFFFKTCFVKIDIENICIRYEDCESNPNQPFCMGVTINKLSTYTANESWEREFITQQDICRKLLTLENLSIFLNISENLFYEELTADFNEEFLDGKQNKTLFNKSEKEKHRLLQIYKYKHFISQENQISLHNSYLVYNFCVESRLILNKNPEANNKPQIELDLNLGGKNCQ